jgi:hypothetical protein
MTEVSQKTRAWFRLVRRACGSACLLGFFIIAIGDRVGLPPLIFAPIAIIFAFGGASAFVLSKWVGLTVGESSLLDAMLFTAIYLIAAFALVIFAVLNNHTPRPPKNNRKAEAGFSPAAVHAATSSRSSD